MYRNYKLHILFYAILFFLNKILPFYPSYLNVSSFRFYELIILFWAENKLAGVNTQQQIDNAIKSLGREKHLIYRAVQRLAMSRHPVEPVDQKQGASNWHKFSMPPPCWPTA